MPCEGFEPNCNSFEDEYYCELCGCTWDYEFERCDGMADACETHWNINDCEDCFCEWTIPGIPTLKLNVGDAWQDVLEVKINVGDNWRTVTEIKINIGDVWRTIYIA